jgi:hypothetical protein
MLAARADARGVAEAALLYAVAPQPPAGYLAARACGLRAGHFACPEAAAAWSVCGEPGRSRYRAAAKVVDEIRRRCGRGPYWAFVAGGMADAAADPYRPAAVRAAALRVIELAGRHALAASHLRAAEAALRGRAPARRVA